MPEIDSSKKVHGKTLRWTFSEGPQVGKTYEHTFHADGTVGYRSIEHKMKDSSAEASVQHSVSPGERPTYAAYDVDDDVVLVSYLADSGFTLTVALNFSTHQLASIASNHEQWFPARGTFEDGRGSRGCVPGLG